MKHILLSALLLSAFVLGACEQQSNITSPVDTQAPVAANVQLPSFEELDNMLYADDPGDRKLEPRLIGMDIAMWIRLLMMANPDMDDATKQALKDAYKAFIVRQGEIIRNTELTPEQKREALEQARLELLHAVNGTDENPGIVTAEQIQKANELKTKLEQERKERLEKAIEARIDMQIRQWTSILKLTERQQVAIKNILVQQQKDIAQARIDYAKDPVALARKLREIQASVNTAIRTLLTPEQQVIWDRMHGKIVRNDNTIEARVDKQIKAWTPILNLTEAQQAEIRDILIRKETAMEQARKDLGRDPAALALKLRELQAEADAAVRGILTPEQQEIWDKMHGTVITPRNPIEERVNNQIKAWTPVLKLTEDQQAAIKIELMQKEKAMEQARKDLGRDPVALARRLKEIETAANAAIRALLTPEQQAIWDKMHGSRGGVIGNRG